MQIKFSDMFKNLFKRKDVEEGLKDYWNTRWKQSNIWYNTKPGIAADVKPLIMPNSYMVKEIAETLSGDYDSKALKGLLWVKNNIKYKSDQSVWNKPEYWQTPEETLQLKSGDCEDGAILLASILIAAGIPNWRVKVAAGEVAYGGGITGHAYCIYLNETINEWVTLDWCYWPDESIANFDNFPMRLNEKYRNIWFTFNQELSWAQYNMNLGEFKNG